ncbi:Mss4-like protein [Pleurostoma richardsiae]|uniref:Mss4-like protein n=1 Tax=Pleurostoma richardsiae TaxID=41990 RepID=A0AA38R5N6_9PEZI|nr:Mss4-like protein [Pleurostoma richardsiae]
MSFDHPLHGGCSCGRNQYIIQVPRNASERAQVLFDTQPSQRLPLASPLTAFIRVPLTWYHSATFAHFPDETRSMIRRVYENPFEQHAKRHFCGFCGTPLSYWSEEPRSEADYIQLTLGSLRREDLLDLEDLGLIPDSESEREPTGSRSGTSTPEEQRLTRARETLSVPWFDSMVAGSRLGKLRTSKGSRQSSDGRTRVEWEIVEWTEDDGDSPSLGKRKVGEMEGADNTVEMEVVRH